MIVSLEWLKVWAIVVPAVVVAVGWILAPLLTEWAKGRSARAVWDWLDRPSVGPNRVLFGRLVKKGTQGSRLIYASALEHQGLAYTIVYWATHDRDWLGPGVPVLEHPDAVLTYRGKPVDDLDLNVEDGAQIPLIGVIAMQTDLPVPWQPWRADKARSPKWRKLRVAVAVTPQGSMFKRVKRSRLAHDIVAQ